MNNLRYTVQSLNSWCYHKKIHLVKNVQLQTFKQNVYFSQSYYAPISLRSVGAHVRGGACSEPSLCSLAKNLKAEACAHLTAKWKYFHGFLTFTDGEYTCEM